MSEDIGTRENTAEDQEAENEIQVESEETTEDELAKLKDQLLRALAEVENTRKRAAREKEEALKYGSTSFARDMLTISDNLQRALASLLPEQEKQLSKEMKSLVEGVRITEKELLATFEKHGVRKITPQGEPFDHDLHQAMFEIETNEHAPGTIVELMQPGYVMHGRLLRPAMVGVAKSIDENNEKENNNK